MDEAQNLQLLLAFSGSSSIDQLVAVSFGMIANGVLTGRKLEQFLGIMKACAPKGLLRRLLSTETSTAHVASEMLLKNVVQRGDEEGLDFLLDIGIRKERLSGNQGGILLQSAVDHGHTKMAKRIALTGANPNGGDDIQTPLLSAVVEEDLDFVKILLEAGAEVDRPYRDSPGTPLSIAVERNDVPCVSMLLQGGAAVDASTISESKGWCDLYWSGPRIPVLDYAYLMGYTTTYRLLLARSLKAKSRLTLSGIVGAARAGHKQLEAYLARRVNVGARKRTMLLEKALSSAIRHNIHDMAINVLLHFNVHPDTPTLNRDDQLPLCQAIPDIDLVGRLVDAGADIDKPAVILSATSQEKNLTCLRFLIASGLYLQALGSVGLGNAVWGDNMDIMRLLLHYGAPATGYDRDGSCLVYVAAYKRNCQALRLLLQHGADVNGVGRDGSRPIHAAASRADLEIAKVLVKNGALLNHSGLRGNRFGTVLEEWAMFTDELRISDVFTYLLENGAPVNAPDDIRGPLRMNFFLTILILKSAEDDLVRLVLNKGARVNETRLPHIPGGRTPVQGAAEMGKLDLVRKLFEKGADLNSPAGMDLGRTALQAACNAKRANMELVSYLLDNGADINAKAGYDGGLTAMQGAVIQGNIKLVALLMDRGADLNADPAIKNGRTALDGAAEHGRLDMVYLLLRAGARCERGGLSGCDSAIELAKKEGHWAVADLLARARPASVDENNTY
jgi:ankyrin repeat protein